VEYAREINKFWITGLKEQIHLMCTGQGVTGRPVPMDKCEETSIGSDAVFFIRPCPICGKYFKRKAFCVTSSGCMDHPFFLGAHLELFKRSSCIAHTCNETFEDDMIELFGYHQHIIKLAKVKAERA
jgi:hypothetical protein